MMKLFLMLVLVGGASALLRRRAITGSLQGATEDRSQESTESSASEAISSSSAAPPSVPAAAPPVTPPSVPAAAPPVTPPAVPPAVPAAAAPSSSSSSSSGSGSSSSTALPPAQRTIFEQPKQIRNCKNYPRQCNDNQNKQTLLAQKCYAWASFNAMAAVGHKIHSLGDQANATEWINAASQGAKALQSVGGTPKRVFDALVATGKMRVVPEVPPYNKQQFSERLLNPAPCYLEVQGTNNKNNLGAFVQFALSKKYPVVLAVTRPANHWIFAVNATATTITCVDQQNPTRGEFTLAFKSNKWSASVPRAGLAAIMYQLVAASSSASCFTVATDGAQIYQRGPQCNELRQKGQSLKVVS